MTVEKLRELSHHQLAVLAPANLLSHVAGFLAIPSRGARNLRHRLRQQEIWTDYRGDMLRLGPAPYVTDAQIEQAGEALTPRH